jgi:hypothetical protein
MKPRLLRQSYFLWVLFPLATYGAYHLYGLPHVIWSYDFYGSHADWSSRRYTRCTFMGPYGAFTTHPTNGQCAWITFYKRVEAGQ